MRKKLMIELFVYVLIFIIGLILLFTYKPDHKTIEIPPDYKIERGENDVIIPFE
ncbi:UNVERIFIED_CONTAM: hypothetical protein Cloal_0235 [Acetivibrio alkalicellulosi]